jgi:hypothetical protein
MRSPTRAAITWVLVGLFAVIAGIGEGFHLVPGCGHAVELPGGYLLVGLADPETPAFPYAPSPGVRRHEGGSLASTFACSWNGNTIAKYDPNFPNSNAVNREATRAQIPVCQCPSDNSSGRRALNQGMQTEMSRSNVAVCFGSSTMLRNANGINIMTSPNRSGVDLETDGAFRIDDCRKWADFRDGTSNTVVASEVLAGQDDSKGPGDRRWDARGMWAWHMMGSFCYTHRNPPNTLVGDGMYSQGSLNCVGGPHMPCDNSHGSNWDTFHAAARSHHWGGANTVFGDGHAGFIAETIEQRVWQSLGAVSDGQVISGTY